LATRANDLCECPQIIFVLHAEANTFFDLLNLLHFKHLRL
jgi:hypothetical protein